MAKLIDLTGQRFDMLTVVSHEGPDKLRKTLWACVCDCGAKLVVTRGNLVNKNTTSCGCKRDTGNPDAALEAVFGNFRWQAEKRKHEWAVDLEDFRRLVSGTCEYCGVEPKQSHTRRSGKSTVTYNGLDRVDNNKGYVLDNLVACCGRCNRAKYKSSPEEFKEWVGRVYKHLYER